MLKEEDYGLTPYEKCDLTPFVALAVARNERAYAKASVLYYQNLAECEAAVYKNNHYKNSAITSCRAELQIKTRQVLGVFYTYGCDVFVDLLKRGWPQLSKGINNFNTLANVMKKTDLDNRTETLDNMVVSCFLFNTLKSGLPDALAPYKLAIAALCDTHDHKLDNADDKQKLDISAGIKAFPNGKRTGMDAIEDCTGGDSIIEAMIKLGYYMGFIPADYVDGLSITNDKKAYCVQLAEQVNNPDLIPALGFCALIFSAIIKDRKFMLTNHRDSLKAELNAAQVAVREAIGQKETMNERLNELERTLDELKKQKELLTRQNDKLMVALASHEGDSQEIAALRSALYDSDKAVENEDPVIEKLPELCSKHIVCIGGHQRWISQMARILPEVTFIPTDVTCDYSLIRNAEYIWFRADYIGHKQFVPIIDICRAQKIPVFYFSAKGASQCAKELVAKTFEYNKNP